MITTIVNGTFTDQISVTDRALNYGDGVFETIAVHDKALHYWNEHYQRLQKGCDILGFSAPTESELLADIKKLTLFAGSSVIKIIVSRGQGGRGYLAAGVTQATTVITQHTWPEYVNRYQSQGIKSRICQHRLIINPALVGIKHLNRLDQVLARNEWHNDDIQEGFMLDCDENITEGTCTNIFFKTNNEWITPADSNCAVAGVMRAAVINKASQTGLEIKQQNIKLSELAAVTECFVCNSIWGVVPVLSCDSYHFEISDELRQLQTELEQEIKSVSYVI